MHHVLNAAKTLRNFVRFLCNSINRIAFDITFLYTFPLACNGAK
jgi:hypothetical protein